MGGDPWAAAQWASATSVSAASATSVSAASAASAASAVSAASAASAAGAASRGAEWAQLELGANLDSNLGGNLEASPPLPPAAADDGWGQRQP